MCDFPDLAQRTAYDKGCRCSACVEYYRTYRSAQKRRLRKNPECRAREQKYQTERLKKDILYYSHWLIKQRAKKSGRRGKESLTRKMLTPEEKIQIAKIYKEASNLSDRTGIRHHVDHIIPLSAGGIHHPDNLQILTESDNLKKGTSLAYTHQDRIQASLRKIVEVYGRVLQRLSDFDKNL